MGDADWYDEDYDYAWYDNSWQASWAEDEDWYDNQEEYWPDEAYTSQDWSTGDWNQDDDHEWHALPTCPRDLLNGGKEEKAMAGETGKGTCNRGKGTGKSKGK